MDVILMPNHIIWQRQQWVHILSLIMQCHTVNIYCDDVLTVHVSIFLTKKQIISIQTQHPQYGLTFITLLCIVLILIEFHWTTIKCVASVNKNHQQTNIQHVHQKRVSDGWDNNLWFSYQFLYTSNTKVVVYCTICTHTWYTSLWWVAMHDLQTPQIITRCSLLSSNQTCSKQKVWWKIKSHI